MKQSTLAGTSRSADKFVVRLPEGMRDRISNVARSQHRSMNSEIISRLEASLNSELNDELVSDTDSGSLTAQETKLLAKFRTLARNQQVALLEIMSVPRPEMVHQEAQRA